MLCVTPSRVYNYVAHTAKLTKNLSKYAAKLQVFSETMVESTFIGIIFAVTVITAPSSAEFVGL